MTRLAVLALACAVAATAQPRTFLVKLSTPVSSKASRAGDPIRAAIISPESLLNGYLEGRIEKASAPGAALVLRFTKLLYKGKSTDLRTEVVDWVNSKGHKSVDDEERPVTLVNGELRAAGRELWLDEGSELRVKVE